LGPAQITAKWRIINNHFSIGLSGNQINEHVQCDAELDANGAFKCTITLLPPAGGMVLITRTGKVVGDTLIGAMDSGYCRWSFNLRKVHP
jgi:hypothetical protein